MKLKPFSNRRAKGFAYEDLACEYLKNEGLSLITKNFFSRQGEIDLIMQHQDTLVFIEVRFRKNLNYGGAKESITPSKQKKIRKTALYYMKTKGREFDARIDVITITGENKNQTIEWIQNAF